MLARGTRLGAYVIVRTVVRIAGGSYDHSVCLRGTGPYPRPCDPIWAVDTTDFRKRYSSARRDVPRRRPDVESGRRPGPMATRRTERTNVAGVRISRGSRQPADSGTSGAGDSRHRDSCVNP